MDVEAVTSAVTAATGRKTVAEGLAWIARGVRLADDTDMHHLLRAVAALPTDASRNEALRTLTRSITSSTFDTAAFLMEADRIDRPLDLERGLREIANNATDKRLSLAGDSALIAAQRSNPLAVESLCYAAGVSYGDLQSRVPGLPPDPRRPWTPSQVRAAFNELDAIIRGSVAATDLEGAVAVRPLELLVDGVSNQDAWERLEHELEYGVPLGVLLAQRAAGGTWLAHRQRTSSKVTTGLANELCILLDDAGIRYLRARSVGGDATPSAIQKLTTSDKQIGLVATVAGTAAYAVIFSVQRDSGSASKAARKLKGMKRNRALPTAVLVAGSGWASRGETVEIAIDFEGRLFSDRDVGLLKRDIAAVVAAHTNKGVTST
jgi:hypothetical protein